MTHKKFLLVQISTLCLLLFLPQWATGRQVENVDEAFEQARELAFAGEYEEARELAREILEIAPDYHDVRILLARTYSWNGRYDEARRELRTVLEDTPDYRDALSASIDNEIWSESGEQAVSAARVATEYYPMDENLLIKLATAHIAVEQERDALRILDRVEQINPGNEESRQLRRSLRQTGLNYTLSASYTYDRFSRTFDPWNKTYIQIARRTAIGSIIARINYAARFGTTGLQPEIDFYPGIADGLYGYLNFGYTESSIYPVYRFGGELYKRLSAGFEVSAGVRYLSFESGGVTIYTGSLSKYIGNWYLSSRLYMTPGSAGISRSLNLTTRYYLNGPENYVGLRGGFGFLPDERRFQDESGDIYMLQSQYAGVDLFRSVSYALALFGSFDIARQELRFDPGNHMQVYTFNIGAQVKF